MNTLAHISAMVVLLWFSVRMAFTVWESDALGYGFLTASLLFIPLTFVAVVDDVHMVRRRQNVGLTQASWFSIGVIMFAGFAGAWSRGGL